jgi:hypothetical protein
MLYDIFPHETRGSHASMHEEGLHRLKIMEYIWSPGLVVYSFTVRTHLGPWSKRDSSFDPSTTSIIKLRMPLCVWESKYIPLAQSSRYIWSLISFTIRASCRPYSFSQLDWVERYMPENKKNTSLGCQLSTGGDGPRILEGGGWVSLLLPYSSSSSLFSSFVSSSMAEISQGASMECVG